MTGDFVIIPFVRADDLRVRNVLPFALELFDFGEHLVECRLHAVEARRREVREVGLGGDAGDIERRHGGADRLERGARLR